MRFPIFAILIFFQATVFGQGIKFFDGSFEELKQEAEKQNKTIFIDCYTSWCGPCKWMAKNVFTDSLVGSYFNENFLCYKLDMEKGEGKSVKKQYVINAFPTLLFINSKGEIQHRVIGAFDAKTFMIIGGKALDSLDNFGALYRKYQSGERAPAFLASYAQACYDAGVAYDIQEYFSTQSDEDLFSETNMRLIDLFLGNMNSREFIFLINNCKKYSDLYGYDRINTRINTILVRNLALRGKNKSNEDLRLELHDMLSVFQLPDSSARALRVEMEYARQRTRDWEYYGKCAGELIQLVGIESIPQSELNNITDNISRYSANPDHIKQALEWSDYILKENINISSMAIKARLLSKLQKTDEALTLAKEALAKNMQERGPFEKDLKNLISELEKTLNNPSN